MVKVAILCGGVGSRLWPLSRKEKPKQFMKLPGAQYNLFQETILRINSLQVKCSELIVVSNAEIDDDIRDCVRNLPIKCPVTFIWEPIMRNTGPAIGSLINYLSMDPSCPSDEKCLVWPSDHLLCVNAFNQSIKIADRYVGNSIVTFGICPTYPETGYGYVISTEDGRIDRFIEKPPQNVAEELIKDPNCYWNSGMFYFDVTLMLDEYRQRDPVLLETVQKSFGKVEKIGNWTSVHLEADMYAACPEVPFDKLIMEQTKRGRVVPFNGNWSDIGSWDSISKLSPNGNPKNVIELDNHNCHIYNYNDKQVISAIGLKNICIINTSDAVLVSNLSQTQKVKTVYQQLENSHSLSVQKHINNNYSWGQSEKLDSTLSPLKEFTAFKLYKCTINERMSPPERFQNHGLMYLIPTSGEGVIYTSKALVGHPPLPPLPLPLPTARGEGVEGDSYPVWEGPIRMELHKQLYVPKNHFYKVTNVSESKKLVFIAFQFDTSESKGSLGSPPRFPHHGGS